MDALSASEPQYFLNGVELLVSCGCASTNVVVFKRDLVGGTLTHLRNTIVDVTAPIMLTSVWVNPGEASIRSLVEELAFVKDPVDVKRIEQV